MEFIRRGATELNKMERVQVFVSVVMKATIKKLIEHYFYVYIASSKRKEGWENSRELR